MVKVKLDRTVDCVVAKYRLLEQRPVMLSSLLLGLYDGARELHHVGVASAFSDRERRELISMLRPYVTTLEDHPWEQGYLLGRSPLGRLQGAAGRWTPDLEHDWVPLRPELVCEVAYDQFEVDRFRHAARFRRWRPDREPRSCTLDQLETSDAGTALAVLRGSP